MYVCMYIIVTYKLEEVNTKGRMQIGRLQYMEKNYWNSKGPLYLTFVKWQLQKLLKAM